MGKGNENRSIRPLGDGLSGLKEEVLMKKKAKRVRKGVLAALLCLSAFFSPFGQGTALAAGGAQEVSEDDEVVLPEIVSALYEGQGKVKVVFDRELAEDELPLVYVEGMQGEIDVTDIRHGTGGTYTLTLKKELDSLRLYTVHFRESSHSIYQPNNYSTAEFEAAYTYTGSDLGLGVSAGGMMFRVWAPQASAVRLNFYKTGDPKNNDLVESISMAAGANGVFSRYTGTSMLGYYYTYTVVRGDDEVEICDPYARTTGLNGERALAIDFADTNPTDWAEDRNPHANEPLTDAVIYATNLRDLSADSSSGIENVGKYLSLSQKRTRTADGNLTGLDHIKDLGVTHIQLAPLYDFGSIDEKVGYSYTYTLGYDGVNYHVPEGSYATDAADGAVRVRELKEMVKALHDAGLSVILELDYSHLYDPDDFCINKALPGYCTRIDGEGVYSDGSGFGNDVASERSMVRKYLAECTAFWAREYHIDGFCFLRSGILDTAAMNQIINQVKGVRPDAVFYCDGEALESKPTKAGITLLDRENASAINGLACQNPALLEATSANAASLKELVSDFWQGKAAWGEDPAKLVSVTSRQEGMTLYDRVSRDNQDADRNKRAQLSRLFAAVSLTAQGIPAMLGGEELLRSKAAYDGAYAPESYGLSEESNSIKWSTLSEKEVQKALAYYKGLLSFRRAHPELRLRTEAEIAQRVKKEIVLSSNVLAFSVSSGEETGDLYVLFNFDDSPSYVTLPQGNWNVYVDGDKAGTEALYGVYGDRVEVEGACAMILVREEEAAPPKKKSDESESESEPEESHPEESEPEPVLTVTPDPEPEKPTDTGFFGGINPLFIVAGGVGLGLLLILISILTLRRKRM